jgi:hypothetical protein
VSARLVALAPSLAGLLLLAAPARAQEAPAQPNPTVVVVAPPPLPPAAAPPPVPEYVPYAPYPPPAWQYPPVAQPPLVPPREARSPFSVKIWAGPGYRLVYDLNVFTGDFGVALGAQKGTSGWYGVLEGMAGRTSHGLTAYEGWVGASWEAVMTRVHLGLGVHFGVLGFVRATTGGTMSGFGLGAFGFLTVDLYQGDEGHALYLGARLTGNWMDGDHGGVGVVAPSTLLGYRY